MRYALLSIILLFSINSFAQEASVVVSKANLRETPSTKGKLIKVLPNGTKLMVVKEQENWYWVKADNNSGWIFAKTIGFTETSGRKPKATKAATTKGKSPFAAKFVGGLKDPTVNVQNTSKRKLDLVLGGILYKIEPGGKKAINLQRGSYEYTATAEGLNRVSGVKWFSKGYLYSWTFIVDYGDGKKVYED